MRIASARGAQPERGVVAPPAGEPRLNRSEQGKPPTRQQTSSYVMYAVISVSLPMTSSHASLSAQCIRLQLSNSVGNSGCFSGQQRLLHVVTVTCLAPTETVDAVSRQPYPRPDSMSLPDTFTRPSPWLLALALALALAPALAPTLALTLTFGPGLGFESSD